MPAIHVLTEAREVEEYREVLVGKLNKDGHWPFKWKTKGLHRPPVVVCIIDGYYIFRRPPIRLGGGYCEETRYELLTMRMGRWYLHAETTPGRGGAADAVEQLVGIAHELSISSRTGE